MLKLGAVYCPSVLVARLRVVPVSTFLMVTTALGTTAPDESVTVPTMVASCAKACTAENARRVVRRSVRRRSRPFTARPRLPAYVDERNFMTSLRLSVCGRVGTNIFPLAVNVNGNTFIAGQLSSKKVIASTDLTNQLQSGPSETGACGA